MGNKSKTARNQRKAWMHNISFMTGLVILVFILILAFFPSQIATHDPIAISPKEAFTPPSNIHYFGTDNYGRDIFSRVVYATRIDLQIGILGMLIPFITGSILGLLAGFYGGWVDTILMRVIDILMAFPFTILIIAIITIVGPGTQNMYIAIWLVGWMTFAKLVRGEVLVLKNSEYIQAAIVAGFPARKIVLRHLLPNVISSAVVYAAAEVVMCMLTGASMSFLGLGVQPPTPEWGSLLASGRGFIGNAWWMTVFPGVFMAITGVGFSLLGDGLTDFLRTKGK